MKTCIVIDSTFYMAKEDFERYSFKEIPLTVNFDEVTYREVRDNGQQAKEVFKKVFEQKKLPTTSQPAGSDTERVYLEAIAEGYDKIISLHISAELSGTAQGVRNIAEMVMEDNPSVTIEVYDSMAAAQASGIIAIEIARIVEEDGDISSEGIQAVIDYYRKNLECFFFVDNLDFLSYGGRIPASLASVGNLFGITPVLTLNEAGGIEKVRTERTAKKGLARALSILKDEQFTADDEIILIGVHVENEAMANKILKEATKATDAKVVYTGVSNFGIVIGNHLGPKAFGFGWIKKYQR
ncbi:DegV family protein [Mollicutes bacterium LVI A0078]|nr:DegV family protein [Mollicutes bacterium LVI A0075]WOO90442.1 DegV family protein [Mollicutes bacterium LVI A0078]